MPQNTEANLPVIQGSVIHGDHAGRTIGFPTANLDVQLDPQQLKPGVYLGRAQLVDAPDQPIYWGLAYFGPRYVMGETTNSFEIYLYDFSGELYGQALAVELLEFMRAPEPFTSMEDLATQLRIDKANGLVIMTAK